jgi:hypothetical protein
VLPPCYQRRHCSYRTGGGRPVEVELRTDCRARRLRASLTLTLWLMQRYKITLPNVIGHNESLNSPYHRELYAPWRCQSHADLATTRHDRLSQRPPAIGSQVRNHARSPTEAPLNWPLSPTARDAVRHFVPSHQRETRRRLNDPCRSRPSQLGTYRDEPNSQGRPAPCAVARVKTRPLTASAIRRPDFGRRVQPNARARQRGLPVMIRMWRLRSIRHRSR